MRLHNALPLRNCFYWPMRSNRKRRKDGSEYVSVPYSTFQYKGTDGKRTWKRIPRGSETRVKKLIMTGERYRVLEKEYRGLVSELGLLEPHCLLLDGGKGFA